MIMKKFIAIFIVTIFYIPNFSIAEKNDIVLITGFETFGKWNINPSQIVAESLNNSYIGNAKIISLTLPVDFNKSFIKIKNAIRKYKPILIINLGLNGRAYTIHVEKIAINLMCNRWKCSRISNEKFIQISPLPSLKIVWELRKNGYKARLSFFAGTYVCNYIFYKTLEYINEEELSIKACFIHLPPLKSQKKYGMKLNDMINAIKIAIKVGLEESSYCIKHLNHFLIFYYEDAFNFDYKHTYFKFNSYCKWR